MHIHVWDVANSREIERITVEGRDKLNKYGKEGDEPASGRWTTPDGTIVSGSSEGDVTFWDGKFGTKLYTQAARRGRAGGRLSPDGRFVYASGIDSQVASLNESTRCEHVGVHHARGRTPTTSRRWRWRPAPREPCCSRG